MTSPKIIMTLVLSHSHFSSELSSFSIVFQAPGLLSRAVWFEIVVLSKRATWSLTMSSYASGTPPNKGHPKSSHTQTTKQVLLGLHLKCLGNYEEPSPQNLLPDQGCPHSGSPTGKPAPRLMKGHIWSYCPCSAPPKGQGGRRTSLGNLSFSDSCHT